MSSWRSVSVAALSLAAWSCSPTQHPAPATSHGDPAPPTPTTRAFPEAAPECTEGRAELRFSRPTIACWPVRDCNVDVELSVANCLGEPVTLIGIDESCGVDLIAKPFTVAPHSVSPLSLRCTLRDGTNHLSVTLSVPSARLPEDRYVSVAVTDTAKAEAKRACVAAGSTWGFHGGRAPTEGCWTPLPDAGKRCVDGADCQGICMFAKEEIVSKTHKRVEGTCSEHATEFGCFAPIPRGATRGGLVARTVTFIPMCID